MASGLWATAGWRSITLSIRPYSFASSGDMNRSRSVSSSRRVRDLTGVLLVDAVELLLHPDELFGVDEDVGRGPLHAGEGLVDHDPAVGQGVTASFGAGGEQERAHAGTLADAIGGDVAGDELHRVVDRHAGGDAAAGAIDVEVDVGLRVLLGEDEELGHDDVGDLVVDGRSEDHDPVLEQARVDVHRPLFATAPLDDDRHQGHEFESFSSGGGARGRSVRIEADALASRPPGCGRRPRRRARIPWPGSPSGSGRARCRGRPARAAGRCAWRGSR